MVNPSGSSLTADSKRLCISHSNLKILVDNKGVGL